MVRILGARGASKTHNLLQCAYDNGYKFACANPSAMRDKSHEYGFDGIDFIHYADLLTVGRYFDDVVIDELESFVKFVITDTGTLQGYNLSMED